jgi:hypothetical protein
MKLNIKAPSTTVCTATGERMDNSGFVDVFIKYPEAKNVCKATFLVSKDLKQKAIIGMPGIQALSILPRDFLGRSTKTTHNCNAVSIHEHPTENLTPAQKKEFQDLIREFHDTVFSEERSPGKFLDAPPMIINLKPNAVPLVRSEQRHYVVEHDHIIY